MIEGPRNYRALDLSRISAASVPKKLFNLLCVTVGKFLRHASETRNLPGNCGGLRDQAYGVLQGKR